MNIDIVLGQAAGRGGLENVITITAHELERRGHTVRIFQMSPSYYKEWDQDFLEIYYYSFGGKKSYDEEQPLFKHALNYRTYLDMLGYPDVILATHTPLLSGICRLAVCHMGSNTPKIISWLHNPPSVVGGGEFLKYSDAHLAISKKLKQEILNFDHDHIVKYIGNPVDFPIINRVERCKEPLKFIYIGRIVNSQKRLDVLLNGLSGLKGNWSLQIIGDGSDRVFCESLAKKLDINKQIKWEGWNDHPWNLVDEASAFILSSDIESFGLVLVEALARGIPVISTDCEGPDEIVGNGINGWLYPRGNSKRLRYILQAIIDEKYILPSSEACISSVQKYSLNTVINNMEREIIKQSGLQE
ncbi:glycosyltransferase [Sporolactobacillus terrae]|uniref:Group 1 glycosyl transferase n=1 Tax=Sporolactobacillus terrae TaxID=269673 RepID=A0A410D772_9BACL|nr:glycosyltransferase [Sporolactobacillus terrae]QAA21964.1 group 1 glycosyl transferase [Sporolactobacillus terrae]QAA24937.1 group 1 glycosyl transferase [Sporolactobacillus terrae]BBN98241.1 hypothetical protein St703_09460 [Sporolactobacillus terrae]